MAKEKQLHKFIIRDTSDNDNYVKDADETIIGFDTYLDAVQFIKERDLQDLWRVETVQLSILYILEIADENAINYGKQEVLNMYDLLCEINRDRSEDWEDYDQTDFLDGICAFSEYKLVGVVLNKD